VSNQGETDLSRARGVKAQRQKQQHYVVENTINFNQYEKRTRQRAVEIIPKSRAQERLVLSLFDPETHITIAVGPAGTGKTYLAVQAAIQALRTGAVDRIILTRPAVGVDEEQHGFLPGDLNQKMEPWTRPLLDVLHEYYSPKDVAQMLADKIIEISPLAYMRGRNFKSAYIIADEMQNATPGQTKMLMTRIGQGSRIVLTGDTNQADRTNTNNGLLDICQKLKNNDTVGIRVCELGLRDIQRHPIIGKILNLYGED
jgi:phosphate starvation-inducible protein PhoH and related proteins